MSRFAKNIILKYYIRKKSAKELTILANLKDIGKIKLLKNLNDGLFWIDSLAAINPRCTRCIILLLTS